MGLLWQESVAAGCLSLVPAVLPAGLVPPALCLWCCPAVSAGGEDVLVEDPRKKTPH